MLNEAVDKLEGRLATGVDMPGIRKQRDAEQANTSSAPLLLDQHRINGPLADQ